MTIFMFTEANQAEFRERMAQLRAGIEFDVDGITLRWAYEYFISWDDMRKPMDLVSWCHHLGEKDWFTNERARFFIEQVCARQGWKLYGAKRRTDRHKLTPELRMQIFTEDGFRCRICNRSAQEDGVKLHVDHIVSVAAGGKTVRSNLQTLCLDCNTGKGAN